MIVTSARSNAASVALLVAHLPGEDMVVVFALSMRAFGLVPDVFAQHRRVRRHRLERIDDDRQRFICDLDQIDRVGRGIARLRDDEGDFLILEQHLVLGQHRLHIAGQRRHIMERERLQVGGGEDGQHAGDLLASETSIDLIRAWACGERTKSPNKVPGSSDHRHSCLCPGRSGCPRPASACSRDPQASQRAASDVDETSFIRQPP